MNSLKLQPKDSLPKEIQEKLNKANVSYSKTKDFCAYKKNIKEIFNLNESNVTEESQLYLAGFIEGEGSINVSIKKLEKAKFGVMLDPEFSITQHANGVSNLYLAMCVFKTGRISLKSGSKATLVYRIDNRNTLLDKVIPFFDKYIIPYGSLAKKERKNIFYKILMLFEEKKHLNIDSFITEMLPLWDLLRVQKGQKNQSFETLEDAVSYILEFIDSQENNIDYQDK